MYKEEIMKRIIPVLLIVVLIITGCSSKETIESIGNNVYRITYDSQLWDATQSNESVILKPTDKAVKKGMDLYARANIWVTNYRITADDLFDLMIRNYEKDGAAELVRDESGFIPLSLMFLRADALVFATQTALDDDGANITYTYFSAAFYKEFGDVIVFNYKATTDEGREACNNLALSLKAK